MRVKLSAADIRHLDYLRSRSFFSANFRIPVFALIPDQAYRSGNLLVALARTYERAQIMAGLREQAGVQLALGREPGAGASGTRESCGSYRTGKHDDLDTVATHH